MDSLMDTYYVYWYRLSTHSDPHRDGYIGITNSITRRCKEHKSLHKTSKKRTHFYNALCKYGFDNVQFEVLHECSKQEALEYEFYYRSEPNIGWNSASGGEDTLGSWQSREVSLYHKDDPEKLYTFESATQASKALGITDSRIRQALYRKSPHYGFDGWAVLLSSDTDRHSTITTEQAISSRISGVKRSKPSHFKGKTDRWSIEDRKRISAQHKGKKLSNEHIQALKTANRKHPNLCREIVLVHKDKPDEEHSFHSISEASRSLNLPLSRLKSKAQRPINVYGKDGWKIIKLGTK